MKNQNSAIDLLDFSIIKFYFLEFKPLLKIHLCIKFDDDDDDDDYLFVDEENSDDDLSLEEISSEEGSVIGEEEKKPSKNQCYI